MEKKLTRSAKERMIGGVCGGLANYFNIDPSIVRILWVLLTLFVGPLVLGIVAYIVMLIIVPEEAAEQQ